MSQLDDATIDHRDCAGPHEAENVPPSGPAATVASILDGYMARLQAGHVPDRAVSRPVRVGIGTGPPIAVG